MMPPLRKLAGVCSDEALALASTLLSTTNELVAAINKELHIIGLSSAFRSELQLLTGNSIDLGSHFDSVLDALAINSDEARSLCQRVFNGEKFPWTPRASDPTALLRNYELGFFPVVNACGNALLALITFRNHESLPISERQYDLLLQAAPDAMLIMRTDGVIELANAHAERMFRYRQPMTGLMIEALIPERFRRMHIAHRQNFTQRPAARPMGSGRADLLGLRGDGSEFPVEISLSPIDVGGDRMVVAAIRDMTQRQSEEDRLRQFSIDLEQRVAERTEELERTNRELLRRVEAQQMAERALAESVIEFRATFEQAAVGIAHVAPDGRFLRVNQTLCDIVGYDRNELLGDTFQHITYPEDVGADLGLMHDVLNGRIPSYSMEKRYFHKSGRIVWTNLTVSLVRYSNGAPMYFISVIKDIDAQKTAELALERSQKQLKAIFDTLNEGVVVFNEDGVVQDMNPAALRMHGYGNVQEAQKAAADFQQDLEVRTLDGKLIPLSQWPISRVAAGEELTDMEVEIVLTKQDRRWIGSYSGRPFVQSLDNSRMCVFTVRDITERKQAAERIRQAGLHDALTGLPNRSLLFEYARHVFASSQRKGVHAGVLYIDLDRFKYVNDLHGHEVGDAVLREVARRMMRATREEDFCFRIGGDEFMLLLSELRESTDAAEVARHLLVALNHPYQIGELEIALSPSIGISIFPRDGDVIDTLINHADVAMYQAKHLGRNNFQFYAPEFAERANAHARIEQLLRESLTNDDFSLYYQPVIDIHTSRIVSVEALLRWPHHDTGPDRFVPVAEATGMINRIGDWVLFEACRQHKTWKSRGLPSIPIAVNVSAVQFRHKDFADRFLKALQGCRVDHSAVQLEVTETALMDNLDQSIDVLGRLRGQGIKILLDDFGTGYSSLSYLSRLPLDKLKVDKSFVYRIDKDASSRAITGAIIALGRTLNLEIVAEGIESQVVLDYLRSHGCNHAQGYYVSRPLTGAAFIPWYHHHVQQTWH